MEHLPFSNLQAKSKPYEMFVDRWGNLTSHEVAESRESWQPGKQKGAQLFSPDQSLANGKPVNLKKDLIFKLLMGNPRYKDEVVIPFHKAF